MTRTDRLPAITFTVEELAALAHALAQAGLRGPFAASASSAAAKVLAISARSAAQGSEAGEAPASSADEPHPAEPGEPLAKVLRLPTRTTAVARPQIDSGIRATVEMAVNDRRVLRLTYLDGHRRASERDVEPAGVLSASGRWYVIGWCRTRQDGRGFRLDRIQAAEVLSEVVRDRDMASILGPLGRGVVTPAGLESSRR